MVDVFGPVNLRSILWKSRRLRARIRGCLLARVGHILYFRSCGSSLLVEGPVWFRQFRSDIWIGSGVRVGKRVTFDVDETANLTIGNGVNLTQDIVISASRHVSIGNYTQVGEFVSIRDANHGTDSSRRIHDQPSQVAPVRIGEDVWIGRGVFIGPGVTVHDGAVIGANAVVIDDVPAMAIVVGVPARVVGRRGGPTVARSTHD